MELLTKKWGPAAGETGWACTRGREGDCESWLSEEEGADAISRGRVEPPDLPIDWRSSLDPEGCEAEYLSVGSFPGSLPRREVLRDRWARRALTQFILLSRRRRKREPSPDSEFVAAVLAKFLRRGIAPPPTLGIEETALGACDLLHHEKTETLHTPRKNGSDPVEIGWRLKKSVSAQAVVDAATARGVFDLDPRFRFDAADPGSETRLTEAEDAFLRGWTPSTLGEAAGHWFIPQAPMDALLASTGSETPAIRQRVDFLFCHPGRSRSSSKWTATPIPASGGSTASVIAISRLPASKWCASRTPKSSVEPDLLSTRSRSGAWKRWRPPLRRPLSPTSLFAVPGPVGCSSRYFELSATGCSGGGTAGGLRSRMPIQWSRSAFGTCSI